MANGNTGLFGGLRAVEEPAPAGIGLNVPTAAQQVAPPVAPVAGTTGLGISRPRTVQRPQDMNTLSKIGLVLGNLGAGIQGRPLPTTVLRQQALQQRQVNIQERRAAIEEISTGLDVITKSLKTAKQIPGSRDVLATQIERALGPEASQLFLQSFDEGADDSITSLRSMIPGGSIEPKPGGERAGLFATQQALWAEDRKAAIEWSSKKENRQAFLRTHVDENLVPSMDLLWDKAVGAMEEIIPNDLARWRTTEGGLDATEISRGLTEISSDSRFSEKERATLEDIAATVGPFSSAYSRVVDIVPSEEVEQIREERREEKADIRKERRAETRKKAEREAVGPTINLAKLLADGSIDQSTLVTPKRDSEEANRLLEAGYVDIGKIQGTRKDVGLGVRTESEINIQLNKVGNARDRLIGIRQSFDEDFLRVGAKWKARGLSIRDYFAGVPILGQIPNEDQVEFLSDIENFRTRTMTNLTSVLNELSGAAVSPQEFERIKETMPNLDMTPTLFGARTASRMLDFDYFIARFNLWRNQDDRQRFSGPWNLTREDVSDSLKSEFDSAAQAIADAEPNLDPRELDARAIRDVETRFGISRGNFIRILREQRRRQ